MPLWPALRQGPPQKLPCIAFCKPRLTECRAAYLPTGCGESSGVHRPGAVGRGKLNVTTTAAVRLTPRSRAPRSVFRIRRELLAAAKALKAQVGQIAILDVRAITRNPAIMIEFLAFAPWNSVIHGAEEQVQEIEEDDSAEDDEESETAEIARARREEWAAQERERLHWTSKRRTETARRLAEAPDFNKCKREADRVYMLRKMLGDETPSDDHMLKEITREALAIYSLDIAKKP